MRNQAIISLLALAAFAKANPDCLSQIQSSGSIIHQIAGDLKSIDLTALKNDFSSLENAIKDVNDSCSSIITPSAMGNTATLIQDCQSLLLDMAVNLSEYENKPITFNTDVLKALKYLASRAHIFTALCQENSTPLTQPTEVKEETKPLENPLPYQGVVDYTPKEETPTVLEVNEKDPYELTPEQMKAVDEILSHTPFGVINIGDKVNTDVVAPQRLSEDALSNMIKDDSDESDGLTPEEEKIKDEILNNPYPPAEYIDITDKVNTDVVAPQRLSNDELPNMIADDSDESDGLTPEEEKIKNEILNNPYPPAGYINITDKVNTTVITPERLSDDVLNNMIVDESDDTDVEGLKETLNKFINRKNLPTTETQPEQKESPMVRMAREIQAAMAKAPVEEKQEEETTTVETEEASEPTQEESDDDVMAKVALEIQAAIAKAEQGPETTAAVEEQPKNLVPAQKALKVGEAPQPEQTSVTSTEARTPIPAQKALKVGEAPQPQTEQPTVTTTQETDKAHVLSGMITGIFDNIRKENEQNAEETPVEPQEVAEEEQASEPVETEDALKPECLSQIYQSFATLYSFGADAEAHDVAQLQADYVALKQLATAINNFCHPQVNFNTPKPATGDCNADISSIATIMNKYKSDDPTDYNNVINTVQSLWDAQSSFNADCVEAKQVIPEVSDVKETVETIDAVEDKTCDTMYIEAVKVIYQLQEDSATEDLTALVNDYAALKEAVSGINLYCEKELKVNMFARKPMAPEECRQHFVELREMISTSFVNKMEDLSSLVQNVWGMASRFLQDC